LEERAPSARISLLAMDAPLASPLELDRWRRATLVAAGIAIVEGVVILVAAAVLLGGKVVHRVRDAAVGHALAAPKTTLPPPSSHVRLPRQQTSVLVLNGNGRVGAAGAAADAIKAHGYTIGSVGNAPRSDYARTLIMYRPGYRPEAVRLRHDLRRGLVAPLDGMRKRDLMGAHLVLVLGS
jgi:hypothetical protein